MYHTEKMPNKLVIDYEIWQLCPPQNEACPSVKRSASCMVRPEVNVPIYRA